MCYIDDGRWRSSSGKVTARLAERNGSLPPGGWLHLRADYLYTGISSGPNAGKRVWENLTLALTFIQVKAVHTARKLNFYCFIVYTSSDSCRLSPTRFRQDEMSDVNGPLMQSECSFTLSTVKLSTSFALCYQQCCTDHCVSRNITFKWKEAISGFPR